MPCPEPRGGNATARVHLTAWRRGCVGRSRRARSRRGSCRPSGSWARPRLQPRAYGSPRLCSGCANSVGWKAAMSRSNFAGRRDVSSASPRSRPSSSGARSMSSLRRELESFAAKQATSVIPIVFATANDPVGTGFVASLARPGVTSPAFRCRTLILLANDLNFCVRLSPVFAVWRY